MKHTPYECDALFLATRIYGVLRLAWSRKKLVSYVDLAMATEEFSGGSPIASSLGMIMDWSHKGPSHCLTAIVSRISAGTPLMPGDGFFGKAHENGYCKADMDETEKMEFWRSMLRGLGYDLSKPLEFL